MPVAESMLGAGEHFVLEIQGDSMINAGVLDGDFVVIKRGDTATSGDIVVALVMGEEATLKRLRKKGASIAMEAANPAYETRIFGPDQVEVDLGPAAGVFQVIFAQQFQSVLYGSPDPAPAAAGLPGVKARLQP